MRRHFERDGLFYGLHVSAVSWLIQGCRSLMKESDIPEEVYMSREGYPRSSTKNEHSAGQWSYPTGAVYPWVQNMTYTDMFEDSNGSRTPGWPTNYQENNYSRYQIKGEWTPAQVHGSSYPDGGVAEGTFSFIQLSGISDVAGYFGPNPADADPYNKVLKQLIKKIQDEKINVGIFLAEINKTANTVTDAAKRIASAYRQVKSGNIGSALGTLLGSRPGSRGRGGGPNKVPPSTGSAANDWLQIQYGWRPLVSDVYGACEELARSLNYKPTVYRVRAWAENEVEDVRPNIGPWATGWPVCEARAKWKSSVKGYIEYRVNSAMAQLAANTGITNPAAVIWELIPYSFVADWFVPVGAYLNHLDYAFGLEFSRGWITIKGSADFTVKITTGLGQWPTGQLNWSGGNYTGSTWGVSRQVMGGFPDVPLPRLRNPLSVEHAANAIALLRQAFR